MRYVLEGDELEAVVVALRGVAEAIDKHGPQDSEMYHATVGYVEKLVERIERGTPVTFHPVMGWWEARWAGLVIARAGSTGNCYRLARSWAEPLGVPLLAAPQEPETTVAGGQYVAGLVRDPNGLLRAKALQSDE